MSQSIASLMTNYRVPGRAPGHFSDPRKSYEVRIPTHIVRCKILMAETKSSDRCSTSKTPFPPSPNYQGWTRLRSSELNLQSIEQSTRRCVYVALYYMT